MSLPSINTQDMFVQGFVDALGNTIPALRVFTPAQAIAGGVQTPVTASATGAASALTATLPAIAGKTTYITGFQVTGAGATAATVITVTVTGVITGTLSYVFSVPAGATVGASPLVVTYSVPVCSSALNTAIGVNVPSFGLGNTGAAVAVQGFYQ